jgi:hypothetical protein
MYQNHGSCLHKPGRWSEIRIRLIKPDVVYGCLFVKSVFYIHLFMQNSDHFDTFI